jgi:probable rRNA maturation factor
MHTFEVPITIEVDCQAIGDPTTLIKQIRRAVLAAAHSQGYTAGAIGVLVTDDESIQEINRRHLDHDYPTDVISFAYSQDAPRVEGELVASLDTAARESANVDWPVLHELLLYIVHGTLHICGLDDCNIDQRLQMRMAEQQVMSSLGISDAGRCSPDAASVGRSEFDTYSDIN